MTFTIHLLDELVVELARIHLSLVEFPLAHCDTLEHLFSTRHQPHGGFLSDTQLEQFLCIKHSCRGTFTTYIIPSYKHNASKIKLVTKCDFHGFIQLRAASLQQNKMN